MKLVSVIWAIVRGLLRALAKDYEAPRPGPASGRGPKERPWWAADFSPPKKDKAPAASTAAENEPAPAEKAAAPSWWGKPAPPAAPPLIKVETDEGTFIAAASFSGGHMMGVQRVERPRQEGESRRRRRKAPPERSPLVQAEVDARPREPEVPIAADEPMPESSEVAQQDPTTSTAVEVSRPTNTTADGCAAPIEPSERPRVERAIRVRSRLGPTSTPGSPWVATTLATRLALTNAVAQKGDKA